MTPRAVTILVGSMGGTAEMVADELARALAAKAYAPRVVRMERVAADAVAAIGLLIVCTSTYGTGDVPDNAKGLFSKLTEEAPDLSGVRFGVFGLGDRHHAATFCFGGQKFDDLLNRLGAVRLVEMGRHDEHGPVYPEDQALEWLGGWLTAVERLQHAS